jgi:hypothetical protein
MKFNRLLIFTVFLFSNVVCTYTALGQELQDTIPDNTYKTRVLESAEIDLLTSFYRQDGSHASVTGGIGNEKLIDIATNIDINIPLNDDDILTIDATVSAYSSASSSNLNPFSGASKSGDEDDDNKDNDSATFHNGSPWVAASGASKADVWVSPKISYSHASDDRNTTYTANLSFAHEFDYISFGTGAGITKQFYEKNTTLGLNANVFFDSWKPQYPIELISYIRNGNLDDDSFHNIPIYDASGVATDKYGANTWKPFQNNLISDKNRNTYSVSISFSQIINKNAQFSLFSDVVYQKGWLANPMQRVYFSDKENYFMGNPNHISNYANDQNTEVFQLADDIERLPETRLKIPIGIRYHHYINEYVVFKTYYRYYYDDWGISSHTANIEIPIKVTEKYTLYPSYRLYYQTASTYFAPFDKHVSTEEFYTSDYDLATFKATQYGLGVKYTDVFSEKRLWVIGLKNISFNYNFYQRTTDLGAHFISLGAKFVVD